MNQLKNKVVFLDTAPLIYFIEGHSDYQQKLKKLFALNDTGFFRFITSSITLLEVLVKPIRDNEFQIAEQYKNILTNAEGIDIYDIINATAIKAAELRANYNIRTPDALQLATSILYNADFFFTNDTRLKAITEIPILILTELG